MAAVAAVLLRAGGEAREDAVQASLCYRLVCIHNYRMLLASKLL